MNKPSKTSTMKTVAMGVSLAILAIGLVATVGAEPPEEVNIGAKLPPKVRTLLIEEMQAIDKASQQIHAAMVQGQHEIVAQKAQAIHDSFIMEQQMTEEDEKALLAAVPESFLVRDEELHALSARLAEAARNRDTTKQLQQFSEMTRGCVECHRVYASARFPGLLKESP